LNPVRSLFELTLGVLGTLAVAATLAPSPGIAMELPCRIAPRFEGLRDALGVVVGDCLLHEQLDPTSGVSSQPTTGGLLAWRAQDNLAIFTDGKRIWTSGPGGLASMAWEGPSLPWVLTSSTGTGSAADVELSDGAPRVALPLPRPPRATETQARFILASADHARASQRDSGVPASVTIAQAILESDWGKSKLTTQHHNYFGIKAPKNAPPDQVAWFDTWEVVDGEDVVERAPFRAYRSAVESFIDHGRFFLRNPRYRKALSVKNDAREFAREINAAGYATDPNYAPKLIALMDKFDLYTYDLR
jgi:hypothetical protein